MVGFFITLEAAPHIAYARLFMDIGLIIGIVAIILALDKNFYLEISNIVTSLLDLRNANYDVHLEVPVSSKFFDMAEHINHLAKDLRDKEEKQAEIKRNLREELLPSLKKVQASLVSKQNSLHSIHPEIGPVEIFKQEAREMPSSFEENKFQAKEQFFANNDSKITNPLTDSFPPTHRDFIDAKPKQIEQDLGELYQNLVEAQKELYLEPTEYQSFIKVIDETRAKLKASYDCKNIHFNVLKSSNKVALQPRIIK